MKKLFDKSFRTQDGCWNCKNVFLKSEYDQGDEYYCNRDKSKRPKCGSIYMKESWVGDYIKALETWDKWSSARKVSATSICDHWKKLKV